MICQKCGGTDFDEFMFGDTKVKRCRKCNQGYRVKGSGTDYDNFRQQLEQERKEAKQPPAIECPYCKSTNTKKISGTIRWLSTGLFGLASGKVGKQWHCNKCGSDF